ncbi:electron transfer flavoprotein subunit beta/FixA family protein [Galactobacter sp.]|uniref:electron transfer flavoprotein subunit beta/FixA family protein n=1 Tax=Galactobacter sp. TaxID=2676125 RepID=UPI0025C5270C|nr:electron transfer flavoprotein subunit beta/FixA family protein [Galactobacter sp.]
MPTTDGTPLKVLVLVKYTPDPQFPRSLGPADEDYRLDRSESVLSELDEYALEAGLRLAEAHGDGKDLQVTALSMGPSAASAAVKKALQIGASAGVLVSDDALPGSDAQATSVVLAAAVRRLAPDVVITGMASTDAETGVIPSMLAARLGWAQLTLADQLELDASGARLRGRRSTATHVDDLEVDLPAVVSVTDQYTQPRYPNFKAIMAARKKPLDTLSLQDLGLDAAGVGRSGSATTVVEAGTVPTRQGGRTIVDDGEAGLALVDFLDQRGLLPSAATRMPSAATRTIEPEQGA